MNILGIDTSAKILNLAVVNNGKMVVDYRIDTVEKTHSTLILPLLNDLLNLNSIQLKQIKGISVSIGPGSFTGLRIGLSTAKGLSFALSAPIVGINTLESYAFRWLDLPGKLCPLIRARRGEYYFAIFNKNNNNPCLIKGYQYGGWNEIKGELSRYSDRVFVFGCGLEDILKEEKIEKSKNIENIYFITNNQNIANAVNIALMGEKKILNNNYDDIYTLSPFYIQKPAAEIKKKKDNSKNIQQ